MGTLSLDGAAGGESSIETIDTEYQNTQIVDTIREAPGKLIRLTVAAVVELPEAATDDTTATGAAAAAAPQVTREQVEKIIRQAVGFDESRNDEIEVMAARMAGMPDLMAPPGWASIVQDFAPLARSASLGIAAVIALLLGTKIIKGLKPVVVEVDKSDAMDPEVRARLADLSEQMRQHPEAVSAVLAGWLSGQETQAAPNSRRKAG